MKLKIEDARFKLITNHRVPITQVKQQDIFNGLVKTDGSKIIYLSSYSVTDVADAGGLQLYVADAAELQITDVNNPNNPIYPGSSSDTDLSEHAKYSIGSGVAQGLGNTTNYGLSKLGVSPTKAWVAGKCMQYFGIFGLSFNRHYAAVSTIQENSDSQFLTALYAASLETCQVAIAQTVLAGASELFAYFGKEAKRQQHDTIEAGLTTVSKCLPYCFFAHRAITQGAVETATSIVAGTSSQLLVESIGKSSLDSFQAPHINNQPC